MNELLIEDLGCVRVLRLNRPDKRNALNHALTQALVEGLAAAEADDAVHVVLMTGNGPAFCAGADVGEFKHLTPDQMHRVEARAELTMQLHLSISRMSKPVIAVINGSAMGGGAGLAIACDLALMAESARIGYPEVNHGIVAAIVLPNLTRQIGRKAAFGLVATGEAIDARKALELGMVNAVHPDDRLQDEALALATRIGTFSRAAMATTKQTFHQVVDLPLAEGLEVGREANKRMRSFISPKP